MTGIAAWGFGPVSPSSVFEFGIVAVCSAMQSDMRE